jgi:hypothetical protein
MQRKLTVSANTVMNSSLLSETYSGVLSKLEENRTDLQVTISTLEKLSITISKDLLDQSARLVDILTIVSEIEKCSAEITHISNGVKRLEIGLEGMHLRRIFQI